jgi:hypothetical protein
MHTCNLDKFSVSDFENVSSEIKFNFGSRYVYNPILDAWGWIEAHVGIPEISLKSVDTKAKESQLNVAKKDK